MGGPQRRKGKRPSHGEAPRLFAYRPRGPWLALLAIAVLADPALSQREETLTLTGQATYRDGSPAAARVQLLPHPPSHARRLFDLGLAEHSAAAETQTDRQGHFELAAPPGVYRLIVETTNGQRIRSDLGPVLASSDLGRIQVPRETELRVRVVDREGTGVEGALVLIDSQEWWMRPRGRGGTKTGASPTPSGPEQGAIVERWSGRTDARGLVHAPVVPGFDHPVRVAAAGFVPRGVPSSGRRSVDVQLDRGVRQELLVHDARGAPEPGAVVRFGESQVPLGVTDAQGRASVWASTSQQMSFAVESADLGYGAIDIPPMASTREEPFVVLLEPPAEISGRVIDRHSGEAVQGALVWSSYRPGDTATTDRGGAFALRTWTSSRGVSLAAAAPEYSTERINVGITSVEAGTEPVFALEAQLRLDGVVVNESGSPVSAAAVTLHQVTSRTQRRPTTRTTSTDHEGRFSLPTLAQSEQSSVTVAHPDYVRTTQRVEPPEGGAPVRLVLERGVVGWGHVVDEGGAPIAGASVKVQVARPSQNMLDYGDRAEVGPPLEAATDSEGRFEMRGLPAGRVDIFASSQGKAPTLVRGVTLEAELDRQEIGTLTLVDGVVLEGRVVDGDGAGIGGAQVTLFPSRGMGDAWSRDTLQESTDAEGHFRFVALNPGLHHLQASADGYVRAQSQKVDLPVQGEQRVRLERGIQLRGTTRGPDGEAVRALVLLVAADTDRPDRQANVTSDADGSFVLEAMPAGSYRLTAQGPGLRSDELRIDLRENVAPVSVSLTQGAVLVGRVLSAEGRAIAGAQVSLQGPPHAPWLSGGYQGPARTDGEGQFRMEGLDPGRGTLMVTADGYRATKLPVELRATEQRVEVTLRRGLSVFGKVTDQDGRAVEAARVRVIDRPDAYDGPTRFQETHTSATGEFELVSLAPGFHELAADKEGLTSAAAGALWVGESSANFLELTLEATLVLSGRVLDLASEEVDRVSVQAHPLDGGNQNEISMGRLDFEGRFELHDLRRGRWRVLALAPDRHPATVELELLESRDDVELRFDEGAVLRGALLHEGQTLAGARLWLRSSSSDMSHSAEVSADGRFEVGGLENGTYLARVASAGGLNLHTEPSRIDISGDTEIDLTVTGEPLEIHVVDSSNGAPVQDAQVAVLRTADSLGPHFRDSMLGSTDAEGRLQALAPPGTRAEGGRIQVRKDGYGRTEVPLGTESDAPLVVSLEPAEGLRVEVVLPDGSLASQGRVFLQSPSGLAATTHLNAGREPVLEASPGRYLLWASSHSFHSEPMPVEIPFEGTFALPVQPAGLVELQNAPPGGARITAVRSDGARYPQPLDLQSLAGGLGPLPPGLWTLTVEGFLGEEAVQVNVQVRAGEVTRIALP